MSRLTILSKPHWQAVASNPQLAALSLDELRALDSLIEFMRDHSCAPLGAGDFRVWARLSGGIDALQHAQRAIIQTDGTSSAQLPALEEAMQALKTCKAFAAISREPRREYERKISVAPEELPKAWQAQLTEIRGRRDDGAIRIQDDLLLRMTQKLCQYAWYAQEHGFEVKLDIVGLRAFYGYETTRLSIRGEGLRPATIKATFGDIRDFMRFSKAYDKKLVKEVVKLLKKLQDQADVVTSQKYAALANIDPTTIVPRASQILAQASTAKTAPDRHIKRNRAMALALPPLTPLRREWHELRYGMHVVWANGRYRLRDYKLRKTRHKIGREIYPGSVHPSVQHFVDATLLQDDDPKYLDVLRAKAEAEEWPLFLHPNGIDVAPNYVSQVWSSEFGTGAHICRTMVYDILFAIGEEETRGGMLLNDHFSRQTTKKYIGLQAKAAALAGASNELDDISDQYLTGYEDELK